MSEVERPDWENGGYIAKPPAPRDWQVPDHIMGHTPPVVSPHGGITQPPVVYAINPYRNTTCITAMILGIATFFTFGFTGIPAVITGHIAYGQCQKGTANQKGMALTGLILGYLAVVGWSLWWVMVFIGAATGQSTS